MNASSLNTRADFTGTETGETFSPAQRFTLAIRTNHGATMP